MKFAGRSRIAAPRSMSAVAFKSWSRSSIHSAMRANAPVKAARMSGRRV
ncbi:MAG: hypothetical protein NTX64_13990 [Elusimicrobia bacterium]|nr:hypothetical protein [Elusimicrobiota bacterium]